MGKATADRETKKWVRNAADERAVVAGMRFDLDRGQFCCDWIEQYCCLYEGDKAGQNIELMPYQRDFLMRLFGWIRWSEDWNAWVRRFTKASLFASKKNGKSPLAAAVGLYLLCGDGEPGQKVYTAAKNGEQARIAQNHAVNMVKQSKALFDDCKVNNATLEIKHLPSNSAMMILTGDDSRGAKAKEGLNGSVIFDELHVVSREVMERVSRAGISRKEPLQLSFSTAGDDPSSVGYERNEYGRQVNVGGRDDLQFLHVEYCSPNPTPTEAEIDANLDAYGKAANPAWGHTVKPDEYRQDWQSSKGNAREVARFKQYRINLWVGSTNQWLDVGGWERGKEAYTPADLAGRDCVAALDLSRTRDMTACVFTFPWPEAGPEVVRLWPLFWMPEDTAKARNHLFPFLSWAKAGFLRLTPGGIVDYDRVKADIRELVAVNRFAVRQLFYDEHLANELTQQLADGEPLAPGIGCERVVFPQSITHFTGPAKEWERRVSAGLVRHPGNPVLGWQVGHCEAKTDVNQNVRPVKPAPHSGKCVDGVVCGVMTMPGVMAAPDAAPDYLARGFITV